MYNPVNIQAETNQELIMAQGGIGLLSIAAANAEDPQTLRMIAGAIANLCGNGKPSLFRFIIPTIVGLAKTISCLHLLLFVL